MIISLTGFMGCGKSSVGALLARELGWKFTDLDVLVQERGGCTVPELFEKGERLFRNLEADCLKEVLSRDGENAVLALGGGTLENRESLELVLKKSCCVYLEASLSVIRERLGNFDLSRPLYSNRGLEDLYAVRTSGYRQAQARVLTDTLTVAQVVSEVLAKLKIR